MSSRRWSRGRRPIDPLIGLVLVAASIALLIWSFGKSNPFDSPLRFSAVFSSDNALGTGAPLRVAGVDVGEVVAIEPAPDGQPAVAVTFEVTNDDAEPLHTDLTLKIRPRLGLEGYDFVDLHPGSPGAPELEPDAVVPIEQTATPVQLDQIITTLQSDAREDLRSFLHEYADRALGDGGARDYRRSIRWQAPAYRENAIANRAMLGLGHHDLSQLMRSTAAMSSALVRDERALQDLVTNLNATMRGFARHESRLRDSVPALERLLRVAYPALEDIAESLPATQRWARDSLPGLRSALPATREAIPFLRQSRALIAAPELPTLTRGLLEMTPPLTLLNRRSVPFFSESRTLSSCQNEVLTPFAREPIPDPDFPDSSGEPFYKQIARSLVGSSGESRVVDANGPLARLFYVTGPFAAAALGPEGEQVFATTPSPILGVRPAPTAGLPPMRPDIPCETQEPPNLNAPRGPADPAPFTPQPAATDGDLRRTARGQQALARFQQALRATARGESAVDPLSFDDLGEMLERRRLGLEVPRELQSSARRLLGLRREQDR